MNNDVNFSPVLDFSSVKYEYIFRENFIFSDWKAFASVLLNALNPWRERQYCHWISLNSQFNSVWLKSWMIIFDEKMISPLNPGRTTIQNFSTLAPRLSEKSSFAVCQKVQRLKQLLRTSKAGLRTKSEKRMCELTLLLNSPAASCLQKRTADLIFQPRAGIQFSTQPHHFTEIFSTAFDSRGKSRVSHREIVERIIKYSSISTSPLLPRSF